MLREASYSSLRLGLYDPIKELIAPNAQTKDDFQLHHKILAGAITGVIGAHRMASIQTWVLESGVYWALY